METLNKIVEVIINLKRDNSTIRYEFSV
ncbi:TPA: hypothetical protein TXL57_001388 [Streptococcus suis]|nr:hypothetical protein [Streptococcus suis]